MRLSKWLREWKASLTTQMPVEYILMLRADINNLADEVKALERRNVKMRENLERENAKLRKTLAKSIRVQESLCAGMDAHRCEEECPLYRKETDDCLACDVLYFAGELGVEAEE